MIKIFKKTAKPVEEKLDRIIALLEEQSKFSADTRLYHLSASDEIKGLVTEIAKINAGQRSVVVSESELIKQLSGIGVTLEHFLIKEEGRRVTKEREEKKKEEDRARAKDNDLRF